MGSAQRLSTLMLLQVAAVSLATLLPITDIVITDLTVCSSVVTSSNECLITINDLLRRVSQAMNAIQDARTTLRALNSSISRVIEILHDVDFIPAIKKAAEALEVTLDAIKQTATRAYYSISLIGGGSEINVPDWKILGISGVVRHGLFGVAEVCSAGATSLTLARDCITCVEDGSFDNLSLVVELFSNSIQFQVHRITKAVIIIGSACDPLMSFVSRTDPVIRGAKTALDLVANKLEGISDGLHKMQAALNQSVWINASSADAAGLRAQPSVRDVINDPNGTLGAFTGAAQALLDRAALAGLPTLAAPEVPDLSPLLTLNLSFDFRQLSLASDVLENGPFRSVDFQNAVNISKTCNAARSLFSSTANLLPLTEDALYSSYPSSQNCYPTTLMAAMMTMLLDEY